MISALKVPTPTDHLVSRRTLVTGGVGVAALTVLAVPSAVWLRHRNSTRRAGRLVTPLLSGEPFYIAHRGGSANWPEMSMTAYRHAVAAGVDALEISLARSSDGVWFGLHDATLDRTSGTTRLVASEHTWAQISRYRIGNASRDRSVGPQPYLRLEQLIEAYTDTHTIFVDPKVVDHEHYPDLLALMDAGGRGTETFIAKSFGTGIAWAQAARAQGYRTWGYYIGQEIDDGSTPPETTQVNWDLLGLDVRASSAAWTSIRSFRKPIVAHIIADRASARRAVDLGASGLMVSDLAAVLGR